MNDLFKGATLSIGGLGAESFYKAAASTGIKDSLENRRVSQQWNEQYFEDHGTRTCIERLTEHQKDSQAGVIAPLLRWTAEDLDRCLKEIDRVLKNGGKGYVFDLRRCLHRRSFKVPISPC